VVRGLAFLVLLGICVVGIRWIVDGDPGHAYQRSQPLPTTIQSLSALAGPHPGEIRARNRRLVYPYSVIPGGVTSADELRETSAHDKTVATHYAGFNYNRARVIEVNEPRLVYLSYRRGNKVYWTRKQASLHKGEKLLTDGRITARTRCGNQVSVLPQANTSPEEPLLAELDRPDAVASGMEAFPSNLGSSLSVDPVMPIGPSSPGGGGFAGGGGPPSVFVPLPGGGSKPPTTGGGGGCTPTKNNSCTTPPPPPPPPPPAVPEPGTMVLVLSGAAAVFARLRQKRQ
jgi:hypothetical protein